MGRTKLTTAMNIGGISSKLGNRYEAKCLVRELLQVVNGDAEWLRFEGITAEFNGFEAALQRAGRTEWHQTKINAPGGNWTINALKREGVLAAFANRLRAGAENDCIFVSQSPARDLSAFCEKARRANDIREFRDALSKGERASIKLLEDAWGSDESQTHAWLRRCWFRTVPVDMLDDMIGALGNLYFERSEPAFAVLRDHLEAHLNKRITPEGIRVALREPLGLKLWGLDPSLRERLVEETDVYLSTYPAPSAGGCEIDRKESDVLDELLSKEDGPTVVLLTGVAGAGKSGVIRGLVNRLRNRGTLHLALRVDQHLTAQSPKDLGRTLLGRDESPAVTLKGLSETRRSVLIVDQVDAVSEVSGRQGAVRQAVLRLVRDVESLKTVRLVLVCRSFDLDNDARLKQLKDGQRVTEVSVPLLDWPSEVEPILIRQGVDTAALSSRQRELLRLPLNLGLFVELRADAGTFANRSDLLERLIERKDRLILVSRAPSWSLRAVLGRLVEWMSERQQLDAPVSVLDEFSGATDALASEHLIIIRHGTVNLFHESLFDHVYARQFAAGSRSIHRMLVASPQHLFRRTQARQILESLRQSDRTRYYGELTEILTSDLTRYHIKQAVALWLASLPDPTDREHRVVLALDDGGATIPALVEAALLSSVGWFDLLLVNGWVMSALESAGSERRDRVLYWLGIVAEHRPIEVAAILDAWWAGNPTRGQALLRWMGFVKRGPDDGPLRELCLHAIRSCASAVTTGFLSQHDMILANWVGKRAEQAVSILQTLFDAWFEAHPGQHPFERDEVRDLDLHHLQEMAKASPRAFLEGAGPALARSMAIIIERQQSGTPDYTFMMQFTTGDQFGADALIALYRQCFVRIATEDPVLARSLLKQFNPKAHWLLLHLHLETIAASNGALAQDLLGLIDLTDIIRAGWQGAEWKSFADAARVSLPQLNVADRTVIERKIVHLCPELDLAKKLIRKHPVSGESTPQDRSTALWCLRRTGHARWAVLETIGASLLSTAGQGVLEEGRRKFAGEQLPRPSILAAGWVQSPIPSDRAALMTDVQWLRALGRYVTDDGRPRRRLLEGGAWQLGAELQRVTKDNPVRFADLVQRIPKSANPIYIDRILSGLAESEAVPIDALAGAINAAHARDDRTYGAAIARVLERHPMLCETAELLDLLLWYGEHGVVDEDSDVERRSTKEEIVTFADLLDRGDRLHVRGTNGVRGSAAEALEHILWKLPSAAAAAWCFIERLVMIEPLDSVRCCLVRPLLPLFTIDRDRVARSLLILTANPAKPRPTTTLPDGWLAPLATHAATHLIASLLAQRPDVGRELVDRLVSSDRDEFRLVGAWHVIRASYSDASYIDLADRLAATDARSRRFAAALAADAAAHRELRDRAERQLTAYFHDTDVDVQAQAAQVFRNVDPREFNGWKSLAEAFIASPAFDRESWSFLHLLETAAGDTGELVVAAAERVIADLDAHGTAGGRRVSELHNLQDLIRRDYSSTESNEKLRERLLDVIDQMLKRNLYGAESIIKAHERA